MIPYTLLIGFEALGGQLGGKQKLPDSALLRIHSDTAHGNNTGIK